MKRSLIAFGVAMLGLAASSQAELVTAEFPLPRVGIALNYGSFGYTPEGGDYTILTGAEIVSSKVVFDWTPAAGVDPTNLVVAMTVPVENAVSEYFAFTGEDLVETTPGTFRYEFVTNDHNGVIRGGRFGIETYGLDPEGNPITLPGVVNDGSGYYFTVLVPEPATLSALAGGAMLLSRRRW